MQPVFYNSLPRFVRSVEKDWLKKGFKPQPTSYNLLPFAFRTMVYWANKRKEKVAKINEINVKQTSLF